MACSAVASLAADARQCASRAARICSSCGESGCGLVSMFITLRWTTGNAFALLPTRKTQKRENGRALGLVPGQYRNAAQSRIARFARLPMRRASAPEGRGRITRQFASARAVIVPTCVARNRIGPTADRRIVHLPGAPCIWVGIHDGKHLLVEVMTALDAKASTN